jgi:hypothetical protein
MRRRPLGTIAIALFFGLAGLVPASPVTAEMKAFDPAAFAAAQNAGASVVVMVHAPW